MVIDTTLFNDEFNMLDIRLAITENYVDKWIILEANKSFSGNPKPYRLSENFSKVSKKYRDRIEVVRLELSDEQTFLHAETASRKGFKEYLNFCKKDDIVIHSDLDEIINPDKWNGIIDIMKENRKPVSCSLEMYFHKFDQKSVRNWKGNVVAERQMFDTPHDLYKGTKEVVKRKKRVNCVSSQEVVGWHWSWIGDNDQIRNKVKSCISTAQQKRDPEQVLESFAINDTKNAINHKCETEIIIPNYPAPILDILKKYPNSWHTVP